MTDNENPRFEAHTEQNKTVLGFRMVGVEKLDRVLIVKGRARFFEGNTMLGGIALCLPVIPFEA